MVPWRCLVATASLATFAVVALAPTWADAGPQPLPAESPEKTLPQQPPAPTAADKLETDLQRVRDWSADPAMRKRLLAAFPFESLEDRLKFDGPGRKRLAKSLPAAEVDLEKWKPLLHTAKATTIPPAALATLTADDRLRREGHFKRIEALAALHQLEVEKFVTNPGFGSMRMLAFRYTHAVELPPKDWSEGDRGEPVTLPKVGGFFTAGEDKKEPTLPSVFALAGFHTSAAHEFARPDSWGLVKGKSQVAGFRPHTLEFLPDGHVRRRVDQLNPIKDQAGKVIDYPVVERWAVRKVELIGLLMNDPPVAYLNPENTLPTMAAVKDAKTRALTEFEAGGLKDLAAGKDVVVVDATTNQVRMVGAIRMAGACLKCHEGSRGDLLGAFTYDLVRDPAFVPAEK